jgi:hypothetical protein
MNINYLFDIKKVKLFFTGLFLSAGGGVGARVKKRLFLAREQKIRWKNVFLFL